MILDTLALLVTTLETFLVNKSKVAYTHTCAQACASVKHISTMQRWVAETSAAELYNVV